MWCCVVTRLGSADVGHSSDARATLAKLYKGDLAKGGATASNNSVTAGSAASKKADGGSSSSSKSSSWLMYLVSAVLLAGIAIAVKLL